jgi:precorrin-8X/cobalt-precorrin-8 methylmutase
MFEPDSKDEMNHHSTEFDGYLMVDWSAASKPKDKEDSIWYCYYDRTDGSQTLENPPTRQEATERIASILYRGTQHHKAILVGFDFPFGYPAGFSLALGWHGKFP